MNRFRYFLTTACLIFLAAPVFAAKAPVWLKGADPRFPESKYVIGVGVGSDLDSARANARAEIARTFRARVQQTMTDSQTEKSGSAGRRRTTTGTQTSATTTQISTEELLEGVVIKETFFDRAAKKYYALAVLDKSRSQSALSAQITDLESEIAMRRTQAQSDADPLERTLALAQAKDAAVERDVLAARRNVLDPVGMANLVTHSTTQIDADLRTALSKIRVALDAPDAPRLKEALRAQITNLGLLVIEAPPATTELGNEPVIRVRASLAVDPMPRGNPQWHFFQWRGSVDITNPRGESVASAAPSGSEGHLAEATARAKAQQVGEDTLAQQAAALLSAYIFGEKVQ